MNLTSWHVLGLQPVFDKFRTDNMLIKPIEMHDEKHQDNSSKTSGLTSDLQNMRLSNEGGIEDMRGLVEVVKTID